MRTYRTGFLLAVIGNFLFAIVLVGLFLTYGLERQRWTAAALRPIRGRPRLTAAR